MRGRYNQYNPKRRIKKLDVGESMRCALLSGKVKYGGNPEHKKNPGDFGLTPPTDPRRGKSLCDDARIVSRKMALACLKSGLEKGLISDRFVGEWPKNIWSVTAEGIALEAHLENSETGVYHGYPMPRSDPLVDDVIRRWKESNV